MASKLNPEILEILGQRTGKAIPTLRSEISRLRQKHPTLTSNAAAHLIARQNKTSVLQKLDPDDKESLKGISIADKENVPTAIKVVSKKNAHDKKRLTPIINYESEDYFVKEHIKELSRAYSSKCFTSVFILFRKIIENLIIDILKSKFPSRFDLIYNSALHRYQDFSVVLDNLYKERNAFTHDGKTVIERLNQLVNPFKKDANDKTHSWFHIVKSPSEIENLQLQSIIELLIFLEKEVGIREATKA
jgi:hypothetical protein